MSRSRLQSKTFAITLSLLIMLSSLSVVNIPYETVGAESTRGDENTWYVDDDAADGGDGSQEKPYNKIQDAVNVSENGDTVRVFAGTYNENVLVNKRIDLTGNGSETTTIDAGGIGNVVNITADWVNISGFLVTGGGGFPYGGIKVESDHNHIFENNCSNNYRGIYLRDSDFNILTNNTCSNNGNGIRLYQSNDGTITNNTCENNDYGIYLRNSNDGTITNNTCSLNNGNGIRLDESSGCTITNNTCSSNTEYGIRLDESSDCTFENNTCSSNDIGISISSSLNSTISNNNCTDNGEHGILLSSTRSSILSNNTCSGNDNKGICLTASSADNRIRDNNCSANGGSGMWIRESDANMIINNTCTDNSDGGIDFSSSDHTTIVKNTCTGNSNGMYLSSSQYSTIMDNRCMKNNYGIYVASRYNTVTHNNCTDNNYHGISLYTSSANTIMNNVCTNNEEGISLSSSWSNTISNNTCSSNEHGIALSDSDENTVSSNTCTDNNHGISLDHSSKENTIMNNTCGMNEGSGIHLYASPENTLSFNNCSDNVYYGISIISNSNDNDLFSNTCSGNDARGITISQSRNNRISNNTCSRNEFGILLFAADQHTVDTCTSSDNEYGIYLSASDNCTIVDSTLNGNWMGILIKESSENNHAHGNSIYNNSECGINATGNGGPTINATNNYWGDNSGPFHPVNNSAGKGDTVTDFVQFNPWAVRSMTWYVATYGDDKIGNGTKENPFLTIQQAVNMSYDWDTIRVFEGVYEENVVVDKSVEIIGNGSEESVLEQIAEETIFKINEFSRYETQSYGQGIFIKDDRAYLADRDYGLVILDISDLSNPHFLGSYNTSHYAREVTVRGDYAYVADSYNGLVIVDISNSSDPHKVGHYDTDGAAVDIVISGNYAYIADSHGGFVIVNITNVNSPTFEGNFKISDTVRAVDLVGKYVFVACDDEGVIVLNVSDNSNPQFAGGYNTSGRSFDLTIDGDYLYVADGAEGLLILDIRDRAQPGYVGELETGDHARGIAVDNDYAYVADYNNGLIVVNIEYKSSPFFAGRYVTTDTPLDVEFKDGFIFVADHETGLIIIRTPVFNTFKITADSVEVSGFTIRNGSSSGILIEANNVRIEDCKISNNSEGIKVIKASENVDVQYCDIFDNIGYGIDSRSNNEIFVSAFDNWWGHPSGPYHTTQNPDGKGNKVSYYVRINPWLNTPTDYKNSYVSILGNDTVGTGKENNPYRTVQNAIDRSQEWDTIEVAPGTYSESIMINKRNLTIIGDSPENTILDAGGAATTCTITADNVELNGFHIKNGNDNGILIIDSSENRFVNCVFPDNSYDLNLSNSKDNQLINTTFETVNFKDASSDISVLWPIDLKVTDNRSGFIPNAHLDIINTFGTTILDGYSNGEGKIPQIYVLEFSQNQTSRIEYNPCTISIRGNGYLDYSEKYTFNSYTQLTCQLQAHILPEAIISNELIENVDMDSRIFFEGIDSTGRSLSYYWEFGDTEYSYSENPSHIYTMPGAYQVNLTVTDDYDNTSMTSIIVVVENVDPTAQADADMNSVYEDQAIQFDASYSLDTPSDIIYFLWDFGDGTQSIYVSPIHVYQNEGEYTVTLTAMDLFDGKSTTTIYISVSNTEPWIIETNVTGMQYPGKPLNFTVIADDTAGDVPSLEYTWDFGEGTLAHQQNVTHMFAEAGIYNVTVTVTDNNGASDSANIMVTITEPEIIASISSSLIFQDGKVFFDASHELDDGSFIYTWYFGDGSMDAWNETSHTYNQSGVFSPWLIINNGIENITIFLEEIVVDNVYPIPRIVADKLQISEDDSIHFNASTSSDSPTDLPHIIFTWDFGDGATGVGIDVDHTYSEAGSFSVILSVNDGKALSTTEVVIEVLNLAPVANAGTLKERKATVGEPIILDASGSTDTPSDQLALNYTWKIGEERRYGKIVDYAFEAPGSFSVIIEVRDNYGAISEDNLSFKVDKASESDDDELMTSFSWFLVIIMVVLLVVIGYLVNRIRDDELIREYIATKESEESIVIEGAIDEDSFKPNDDTQEETVEVADDQDTAIVDEGVEVLGEGEENDSMFKRPDDDQQTEVEATDENLILQQKGEEKVKQTKEEVAESSTDDE